MERNFFAEDFVLGEPDESIARAVGASAEEITAGESLAFTELGGSISGRRGRLHGATESCLWAVERSSTPFKGAELRRRVGCISAPL